MGQEQKLLFKHIHVTMQKSYLEHNIQCAILVILVVRDYKIDSYFMNESHLCCTKKLQQTKSTSYPRILCFLCYHILCFCRWTKSLNLTAAYS